MSNYLVHYNLFHSNHFPDPHKTTNERRKQQSRTQRHTVPTTSELHDIWQGNWTFHGMPKTEGVCQGKHRK